MGRLTVRMQLREGQSPTEHPLQGHRRGRLCISFVRDLCLHQAVVVDPQVLVLHGATTTEVTLEHSKVEVKQHLHRHPSQLLPLPQRHLVSASAEDLRHHLCAQHQPR